MSRKQAAKPAQTTAEKRTSKPAKARKAEPAARTSTSKTTAKPSAKTTAAPRQRATSAEYAERVQFAVKQLSRRFRPGEVVTILCRFYVVSERQAQRILAEAQPLFRAQLESITGQDQLALSATVYTEVVKDGFATGQLGVVVKAQAAFDRLLGLVKTPGQVEEAAILAELARLQQPLLPEIADDQVDQVNPLPGPRPARPG